MPEIPSDTPLSDRAKFYRARAAVAHEFVLKFRSPDLKESYLTIAQSWTELAAETERSCAADGIRRPLEVSPRLMRHWEAANRNTRAI